MRILSERKRSSLAQIQLASWALAGIALAVTAADPEHRFAFVLIHLFARLSGLILA